MAGTWTVYNRAKHYIGDATINLSGGTFKVALFTSASNAATVTLSTYSALTNQVAQPTNGDYSTGGQALASLTWTSGTSAGQQKWDAADPVWTASSSAIVNWKHAVIYNTSSNKLVCYATLTTAQQTLSIGSTLTIQLAAGGILSLT